MPGFLFLWYLCPCYIQEYWCKRLHPKNVCEKVYRQPPFRESLRKGKLRKQELVLTKQKTALIQAADSIGKRIQYDCPGFLPNGRQVKLFLFNVKVAICGLLVLNILFSFFFHGILFFLWVGLLSLQSFLWKTKFLLFSPVLIYFRKGFWLLVDNLSLIW